MTDTKWNAICNAFDAYWLENNNNGNWPKHHTTLTGSWRSLVEDEPDPDWTGREATLRINGLKKLLSQAKQYNIKMDQKTRS